MADGMRLEPVTPVPITEALPRPLKVTVLGSRTQQTSPQPRLNPLRLWPWPSLNDSPYLAIWRCVLG